MVLLIGPEGGLSDREVSLAGQHDFLPVKLGPRVLRTARAIFETPASKACRATSSNTICLATAHSSTRKGLENIQSAFFPSLSERSRISPRNGQPSNSIIDSNSLRTLSPRGRSHAVPILPPDCFHQQHHRGHRFYQCGGHNVKKPLWRTGNFDFSENDSPSDCVFVFLLDI